MFPQSRVLPCQRCEWGCAHVPVGADAAEEQLHTTVRLDLRLCPAPTCLTRTYKIGAPRKTAHTWRATHHSSCTPALGRLRVTSATMVTHCISTMRSQSARTSVAVEDVNVGRWDVDVVEKVVEHN